MEIMIQRKNRIEEGGQLDGHDRRHSMHSSLTIWDGRWAIDMEMIGLVLGQRRSEARGKPLLNFPHTHSRSRGSFLREQGAAVTIPD